MSRSNRGKKQKQARAARQALAGSLRNRVVELVEARASELRRNALNWREHPLAQREAMEGILAEVGMADALLARRLPDGTLELLDGHLRADLAGDGTVPVLVVDLSDAEARLLLAVHDPLGELAETNEDALQALLAEVDSDQAGLRDLLLELSGYESESDEVKRAFGSAAAPGMELQPYEHYDYVLFLFRSKLDFEAACEQLGLTSVQASAIAGKRKIGLGRCVPGPRLLELLEAAGGRDEA